MRGRTSQIISPWICALLVACNPKGAKINESSHSSKLPGAETSADPAEKVDVPVKIAGSYLVCAMRKQAKPEDLSSQFGCRLNEEGSKQKVDLSSIPERIIWKSNLTEVSVSELEPANIWHAYYQVKGESMEAISSAISRLDVQIESNSSSQSPSLLKQAKLGRILQSAVDYGDTNAPVVLEGGLDPNDASTL